jgi:hypothetical protein
MTPTTITQVLAHLKSMEERESDSQSEDDDEQQ